VGRALTPAPITTEAEYARQLEHVEHLMEKGEWKLFPEEGQLLELLTVLVKRYEGKHNTTR